MAEPGWFRKHFMCDFALCETFMARSDETHLWGECIRCGKRGGIVSRTAIRAYAEAQERQEAFEKATAATLAAKPRSRHSQFLEDADG